MNDLTRTLARKLTALYKNDEAAKALFDNLAQRERDASYTSIGRIEKIIKKDRTTAINLSKELAQLGCGTYIVGRRGGVSRFEWEFSCISLGKAASGKAEDVNELDKNKSVEDIEPGELPGEVSVDLVLTISQAKHVLARSLKIPVENIEILIKG